MQSTVLIIHTLIAIGIIVLVLLQRGKGAEAGAAFGAGASGTVFGARGSGSFFSRATAILATAFFATSLTLAWISSESVDTTDSLLEEVPAPEISEQVPADTEPAADGVPDLPESDSAATDPEDIDAPSLDTVVPEEEPVPEEE